MEDKKYLERIKESCTPSPGRGGGAEDENEEDLVFPGFRFHPTDQELVGFYLTRKVEKKAFSIDIIKEIDIYKHDPWDLPKSSHLQQGSGENEWYFFCLRGRKYRNSIRPNRITGSGFWKATGIDKPIYPSSSSSSSTSAGAGECIGLKKSLVYYRGSASKGTKTDWMMHEFRLPSSPAEASIYAAPNTFQDAEIWTICRIFKRNMSYNKRCQQQKDNQHGKGASTMINNKRSHHYQQQQLELYYHHHHRYTSDASMAINSFKSDERVDTESAHVTNHHQPFLLHGFHSASSAAMSTPGIGAPPPLAVAPGWSELMSFRDSGSSWDELGRIMEISTTSAYL